ncbi:MAG TPA: aminoacyl--tRNA ligase-related protein [Candidatus Binatia bacterium]|nr:aminoacyl--tRNA ligase-related protein [Candidatus Binatia bacterium]
MRLSKLFTKTTKTVPADETANNAKLLIRAGFIHKEMAGVYTFLPLGLKVLNNIANVVREEMDKIGGQEVLMPALQVKERYELTGRWDDKIVDDWFKTRLVNGTELGLGFSHEENLSPIVKNFINSYKDLPLAIYQIQTKFRNELRSKSGLMRGREFLMKDMYSFAISQPQHDEIYSSIQGAYRKIFDRLEIGDKTFLTSASGGSFSKYSHEFQALSEAGEDTIYLDRVKKVAINREVLDDKVIADLGLKRKDLEEVKAIEVGNIFSLGTKFSEPFNLMAVNDKGVQQPVLMGCYGIGISRVMGTIAELKSDDRGLVWPVCIAPAKVQLVRLGDNPAVIKVADKLYTDLTSAGTLVIYDDRDERAGEKLADADLMGTPYRLVVSDKTIASNSVEFKKRSATEVKLIDLKSVIKVLENS